LLQWKKKLNITYSECVSVALAMFDSKPRGIRRKERSRLRWLEVVEKNQQEMNVNRWRQYTEKNGCP
jgi:hypothetical protein